MEDRLAPGLIIHALWEVPIKSALLQNLVQSATFTVTLLDPLDRAELSERIAALLAAASLPRERRDKSYDLRPLIQEIRLLEGPDLILHMALWQLPGKTGRPDEVAAALGLDPLATRIHRTALILDEADSQNEGDDTLADNPEDAEP